MTPGRGGSASARQWGGGRARPPHRAHPAGSVPAGPGPPAPAGREPPPPRGGSAVPSPSEERPARSRGKRGRAQGAPPRAAGSPSRLPAPRAPPSESLPAAAAPPRPLSPRRRPPAACAHGRAAILRFTNYCTSFGAGGRRMGRELPTPRPPAPSPRPAAPTRILPARHCPGTGAQRARTARPLPQPPWQRAGAEPLPPPRPSGGGHRARGLPRHRSAAARGHRRLLGGPGRSGGGGVGAPGSSRAPAGKLRLRGRPSRRGRDGLRNSLAPSPGRALLPLPLPPGAAAEGHGRRVSGPKPPRVKTEGAALTKKTRPTPWVVGGFLLVRELGERRLLSVYYIQNILINFGFNSHCPVLKNVVSLRYFSHHCVLFWVRQ